MFGAYGGCPIESHGPMVGTRVGDLIEPSRPVLGMGGGCLMDSQLN